MAQVAAQSGPRSQATVGDRVSDMLRSQSAPIDWKSGIDATLALGLGMVVGAMVSPTTVVLTGVTACLIGMAGGHGSLRVGLRSVVVIGAAAWVAVMMARLVFANPWVAALAMAGVAFLTTVVQALPQFGMNLGVISGWAFFLVVTKDWGSAVDAPIVGLAALLSIVVAAVTTILVHIPDPDRDNRRLVAMTFLPATPFSVHGIARSSLRLESDPPLLTSILQSGDIVALGRALASRAAGSDPRVVAALEQAAAAATEISAAMQPRGRLAGRVVPDVDLSALDAAIDAPDLDASARLGLENVKWGLTDARAFLEGRRQPRAAAAWPSPARQVLRSTLSPEAGWFRYGVQRAIALGVGVLAFKLLVPSAAEQVFWVLLTVFVVMQPNQLATARSAFQRGVGTVVGAVLAALLSLAVPPEVLVPYAAGVMLILGVGFGARNPMISAALYGAFMAVMIGVPVDNVPEWAFWRVVATTIGCVLALVLALVVLPARAHPRGRAATARSAIGDVLDALAVYCGLPAARQTRMPLSAHQAVAVASLERLDVERSLLHDRQLRPRCDEVAARLAALEGESDTLVLVALSKPDLVLIQSGLDRIRARLAETDPLIGRLPQRA
jgi:MFS family permease